MLLLNGRKVKYLSNVPKDTHDCARKEMICPLVLEYNKDCHVILHSIGMYLETLPLSPILDRSPDQLPI